MFLTNTVKIHLYYSYSFGIYVPVVNPLCKMTDNEFANMMTKDHRHLLPKFQANRKSGATLPWVVSNLIPLNMRNELVRMIERHIQVTFGVNLF